MEVWMSGEVMAEVADSYSEARKKVEEQFNEHFSASGFGKSLKSLTFIGILRPEGDTNYPETTKFHRRDCDAEFRLKIPYDIFRESDEFTQRKLVARALLRAIESIPEFKLRDFDADAFIQSYKSSLQDTGWL